MTYFNRPRDEFVPSNNGPDNVSLYATEGPAQLKEGLYYRSRIFPALQSSVQACVVGDIPFRNLDLDAYQSWVETGWKEPHASLEAAERFRKKGLEEANEVGGALQEIRRGESNDHLTEELGDFMWVTEAFANNGGVITSDSIKMRLYDYGMGTKVSVGGMYEYPKWYDVAMQLAIKRGSLTVGDIEDLIIAGFIPQGSAAMNTDGDDRISSRAFASEIVTFAMVMAGINEQQFENEERIVTGSQFIVQAENLGRIVAESIFRVAAIAQKEGTSLSEVVEQNVIKISGRITTGTVDKGDGTRTSGLE